MEPAVGAVAGKQLVVVANRDTFELGAPIDTGVSFAGMDTILNAGDVNRDGFGDVPPDSELSVPQRTAWEVSAVGRMARMGYPVRRQRWLYAFRNRYGFTDTADDAFEQLWHGDDLTWAEIDRLSETTAATNPGPLQR